MVGRDQGTRRGPDLGRGRDRGIVGGQGHASTRGQGHGIASGQVPEAKSRRKRRWQEFSLKLYTLMIHESRNYFNFFPAFSVKLFVLFDN